jgi:hypothetical protein
LRDQTLTISAKPDGVGAVCQLWTREWRTIWTADALRGDGKRFVVGADEILTAFLEMESAKRLLADSIRLLGVEHESLHSIY